MRAVDKVIGYNSVKEEMFKIIDLLNNYEKYEKNGVNEPKGLMLVGEPGIGKSLMAECFIEEVKRKCFIIRKTKSDGDFINYIKDTFDEARKSAPSIIFIDDLDRFENNDKEKVNGETYITIQSLIDEVKNEKVFVVATVNNEDLLPYSLCRDGRFDKRVYMKSLRGNDAIKLVKHYLKKYSCSEDIDHEIISKLLNGKSCATLKSVINEAGIISTYNNKNKIDMEDMWSACLRTLYNAPASLDIKDNPHIKETTYHEAGHAVVREVLDPGSINFVSILKYDGNIGGITSRYENIIIMKISIVLKMKYFHYWVGELQLS